MRLQNNRLTRVTQLLEEEIPDRIPGAVVSIGVGDDVLYHKVLGYAENLNGVVRPMRQETLFDLASLTKVTATLPSVLSLVEDAQILLGDPVATFIPEFADDEKSKVTVRQLLTHTAGLPPFRQFYQQHQTPEEIVQAVREEPLESEPGTAVVYSDLCFMLLGKIVEIVTGKPLHEYAKERVFGPLGMNDTGYCPPPQRRQDCAATEQKSGSPVKVGIVHDENAEALGGVSGHAGLFAPMADLVRYMQFWVDPSADLLSRATKNLAVSIQTQGLNGNRGLGWVCRHDPYDHTGDIWPGTTVGHTGFTGTSLSFDPVAQLWMVILTNDVHYGRQHKTVVRLRRRLHNIVASAIAD